MDEIACNHWVMPFLYVMWSLNLLKLRSPTSKKTITTKLGGNTYKNETVAYFHMTWVNHANVIKATAPKVALMKEATWFSIIWYPDKWKEHMQLLQKLLDIKFDRKKHRKQSIYPLGSKFIWLMQHHKIN